MTEPTVYQMSASWEVRDHGSPLADEVFWWFGDRAQIAAYLDRRVGQVADHIAATAPTTARLHFADLDGLLAAACDELGVPRTWPNRVGCDPGVTAQQVSARQVGSDITVTGRVYLPYREGQGVEELTATRVLRWVGWTIEETP